ncbi:MAG: lamin tail domain-containing protein [Bacteroidales bacterium]|nr:lamin tail domain-containing protein [Bacteroidales bacterium]
MKKGKERICAGTISFVILFLSFSVTVYAQTSALRINEFMALNQTTLMDEDAEYSDWIEIYNPTSGAVNLSGWSLTDDITQSKKWIFPDITINSGAYLVLFASGKNRNTAGNELHTNFKLSGDGEYLALFDQGGTVITEFNPGFPVQQTDVSYGYYENNLLYFADPTPGADNTQSSATVLPPPVFNIGHGFFESPFHLTLSCDFPGADIYYTTDGSTPGFSNGTEYTSPLNIQTTSVIRAVTILDNTIISKVVTQTYLFSDSVIHQPNNPAGYPSEWGPYVDRSLSGNAIADYEMDPEMVADPLFANKVKEALKDIPTLSLVSDKGNFFSHEIDPVTGGIYIYTGAPGDETGLGWERPVSVEFFNSKDSIDFQINCGVRLQGGHSRRPEKNPKHSFLLVFKSEYGPSRLDYPLFGERAAQNFNNLILRAGFGLTWLHWNVEEREQGQLQRDIWTKDAQRAMGHPASHSGYVHLYINGIYWGVYAPSERMDADYAVSYFGGDETEYDVIKDYMESGLDEPAVDGNTQAWDAMISMANAGLTTTEAYQAIQGNNPDGMPDAQHEAMIDVVNFADYMLLNFYGSNTDWDHHNWAAIRNRVNPGKGFKFLSWDAEHMIKAIDGSVLGENNDYCPSRIFQQMKENEDFRHLFADRVVKHCYDGGVLTPEGTVQLWSSRRSQVEKSMDAEAARWGDYRRDVHPWSSGPYNLYTTDTYWLAEQNFMSDSYFPSRTSVFINQLRNAGLFPLIDPPAFLINGSPFKQNTIEAGDVLTITAAQGTIYYTTDGNNPVVWQSAQGSKETFLIAESADKRVLVPKADIGNTWFSDISYNDTSWQVCSGAPGGIGYETGTGYESYITLDVRNDMYTGGTSPNTSCYVRIPFTVNENDLSAFTSLILGVRYDDGFIAYLNGKKVAEALAPASPVWNSAATGSHEATSLLTFNISDCISDLKSGDNLLAVQGLNQNITSTDFIISVTLTASDQAAGATISESAVPYAGQIALNESSNIKARTFYNGEWSALNDRYFLIPDDLLDIRITEIHYHPLPDGIIEDSEFEFIEMKNTGTATLNLDGLRFIDGIDYTFASETALRPNEFVVLAANYGSFFNRYGFVPFDEYNGQLDNNGEWIILVSAAGDTLCSFRYNDGGGWPVTPDGMGNSLVPTAINPSRDQNDPYAWRASYYTGGSPNRDDIITETITVQVQAKQHNILNQNYPNPFTDITYIDYQLYDDAQVKLSVYNMTGQQVVTLVNNRQPEGMYQVDWNGTDRYGNRVTNGMYFYRIEIVASDLSEVITRKMLLMR